MLPVKVSLNMKEEHDGEHLRLMVSVINVDQTFEASVALCYLFVLIFLSFCVCMYFVYMFMLLLCSLLLLSF